MARGGFRKNARRPTTICQTARISVRLDAAAAAGLSAFMRRRGLTLSAAIRELLSIAGRSSAAVSGGRRPQF